ncbi:hypothetical protein [Mycolicibacter acidiphilus]|uniref:hypothetical protein n=1 Tax=Mycolicibacter acidiphilus TaxID=2835306 RepID=UPI001BD2CAE2|nr:hypothetical protein [Mycolicibacter acidiphilus]
MTKWFSAGMLVYGSLFCAVQAVRMGMDREYVVAALCAGLALLCFIQIAGWLPMIKFVPTATSGAKGTIFRPDRRIDVLSVLAMLDGTVVFGTWAVLGHLGRITTPAVIHDNGGSFLMLFGGPALVCASFLWLMLKRRGCAYVQLTVDGFLFAEGIVSRTGLWSEVTAMSTVDPRRWLSPRSMTLVRADGKTATVGRPDFYADNGDALWKLVHFYWLHPECRPELTDGRALVRLRDEQFALD